MKVGDYVRTERYIGKIIQKTPNKGNKTYTLRIGLGHHLYITIRDCWVLKSSQKILDVLEAGDVITTNNLCGEITTIDFKNDRIWLAGLDFETCSSQDIKSLITKECYEAVSFKVGDYNGNN